MKRTEPPMKKLLCLLLTLICALGLCSCSGEAALPKKTDLFFLKRHPIAPLSAAESGRMQSAMSGNRAWLTEDALYTLELDRVHLPVLASYRWENGKLSDFQVLATDCVPMWLTEHEGALYYINDKQNRRLERLDLESMERTVLNPAACSYLQIKDGELYYRNEEHLFCAADLDGQNERIVIDKPCCYPWFLGDVLIYQSESEGEILKLRYELGNEVREIALTEGAAYAPMVIGDRLYYTMDEQIHSMGINGMSGAAIESPAFRGAAEYLLEESRWYARAISQDYGIEQWRCALPDGGLEFSGHSGYDYCDYADGNWRVDAEYFADARLRSFALVGQDGSHWEYLYGICSKVQ